MEFTLHRHRSAGEPGALSTRLRYSSTGLSTNTSLACFVEFRAARDRLLAQVQTTAAGSAPAPAERPAASRTARLAGRAHPLETSLDWLLSAAALGAVLLGILSL
ncbi:MAG TPA: hypothetical protein VGD78_09105 [Chthoniobacterales bacterium]